MRDLDGLFAAIDSANAADPNTIGTDPLAQRQGRLASEWLTQLATNPSVELQVAIRAHHLRRWEVERKDFPTGRQGYLAWRRQNKTHQAASLAEIMSAHQWPTDAIERTEMLLTRTKLRTDPETQILEDAACLVFLETQFASLTERMEHDQLVGIVAKTLKKMSSKAVALAGSIELSAPAQAVLNDAVSASAPETTS